MRTKATFLAGFVAGYVLGSRAGRERYEQIRRGSRSFMSSPRVQQTASKAQAQASELVSTARHKVEDKVGDKLPSWATGRHDAETNSWAGAGSNGHPAP